jgi:hypothetical protein
MNYLHSLQVGFFQNFEDIHPHLKQNSRVTYIEALTENKDEINGRF